MMMKNIIYNILRFVNLVYKGYLKIGGFNIMVIITGLALLYRVFINISLGDIVQIFVFTLMFFKLFGVFNIKVSTNYISTFISKLFKKENDFGKLVLWMLTTYLGCILLSLLGINVFSP